MDKVSQPTESKKIDFLYLITLTKSLFFYLFKKWWVFALVGLIGAGIGFTIAYLERPTYESHLTFALEDGDEGIGGAFSLAAEFGFNIGGGGNIFQGENIISLLSSRRIVERVLLSVDTFQGNPITMVDYLAEVSKDTTKKNNGKKLSDAELRLSKISFPVGQSRETYSYLQDSVLMNIYENISKGNLKVGKPDKKLNLFEISIVSPDERFTKIFTEKLVKEASDFYAELKSRKSKETLDILEKRVALTKGNLNTAIISKAMVQDADINPAFQAAQAELQKKQVDISAYSGAYGELYKNLELARYQYLKSIPLLQIIDGADYPMKRLKKGKFKTGILYGLALGFLTLIILSFVFIIKRELAFSKLQKTQDDL